MRCQGGVRRAGGAVVRAGRREPVRRAGARARGGAGLPRGPGPAQLGARCVPVARSLSLCQFALPPWEGYVLGCVGQQPPKLAALESQTVAWNPGPGRLED